MFHELVKEVWESTPGLENALLSGVDGIVLAKCLEREQDDFIAAEAANLVKECQRFGGEIGSGPLLNLCTQYEDVAVIIQMVTEDYFLLGVVKDPKYFGEIRYRFALKSYEWYSAIA